MMRRFLRLALVALCAFFLVVPQATPTHAAAGVTPLISFQGKVATSTGSNVTNGSYTFIFALYSVASAGSAIWTETKSITVTDGVFQTNLGSVTALPGSLDFNSDSLYLGITFNGDGEMSPRVRFTAVPQAFNAKTVAGLTVADTTGSLTVPNAKSISFADNFSTTGSGLTFATGSTTTATLPSGTITLADLASTQTLTNKTIGSTGLVFSGATTDIDTAASEALNLQGRAASSFATTAGAITLQPAGSATGSTVQIGVGGAGSTTPDILAVDVKSDAGDPTGVNGALYYNAVSAKLRCYQASAWTDCVAAGGGSTPTFTTVNGLTITANGTNTLTIAAGKTLAVSNSLTFTGTDSTSFAFPGTSDTVAGLAATQTLTNKTIGSTGLVFSGATTDIDTAASEGLALQGRAASSFTTTAGAITLQAAGTGTTANIQIGAGGSGSTTPDLFVLDTKSDATDPTGTAGASYYNVALGKFRCYQGAVWQDCDGVGTTSQPYFPAKSFGYWSPIGSTATTFTAYNLVAPTVTGTASASAQTDDYYVNWASASATSGLVSGLTQGFTQTQGRYLPKLTTLIRTDAAITNTRIWVALSSAALTGVDGTGALTTRYVGLRYSTAASDTAWQCASGDGTTGSVTSTGVTVAAATSYLVTLSWAWVTGTGGVLTCSVQPVGSAVTTVTKSTNLDTTGTTNLGITDAATTLSAAIINYKSAFVHLESK